MAVRVLDAAGIGTTADIVLGVIYAVDNGARIVNLSIGGSAYDSAFADAIEYARTRGTLVVCAAGNEGVDNDGGTHTYPCDYPHDNIIGVAAIDQSYELTDFSNYGSASVDIGAPGANILSAWNGAERTISETLNGGWVEGGTGGWAYGVRDLGYGNVNLLLDPSNWPYGYYANNAFDRIWKTFDLGGWDAAILQYWLCFDLEQGYDGFYTFCSNVTGDPFSGGIQLAGWTGSTGGYFYLERRIIPPNCLSSSCTVGFALVSDSTVRSYGAAITGFAITGCALETSSYRIINGTSMAAPHVAGLAALLWAFNPGYDYRDVRKAIFNGGMQVGSLAGKTTTGRAASAWGSLRYVKPPTGLKVTVHN